MGRQNGDSTMVNSSIALLQERFRQLERVREKREEKELLKLFAEPDPMAPAARSERNKSPQLEMMIPPHRPPLQDSLSLGLNSPGKRPDFRDSTIPSSSNLWPISSTSQSTSRNFDNSDVDTSLHL
ncbi:uncharacterized protein LOC123216381 [Mangifera indica]|uniref:uncharacterized protein LOC123216381 n=1 Tax=Mangifera indica TaxID=29780 RepID=UPI001CFB52D7|nr:uncharacterized protein LOC123216381 [Mangifera indica]